MDVIPAPFGVSAIDAIDVLAVPILTILIIGATVRWVWTKLFE
jgi:hypothetical protein